MRTGWQPVCVPFSGSQTHDWILNQDINRIKSLAAQTNNREAASMHRSWLAASHMSRGTSDCRSSVIGFHRVLAAAKQ